MNLIPAVLILAADERVVPQQQLAAAWVAPYQHAVVQRRQTSAVLVVGRRPQIQQRLTDGVQSVREKGDIQNIQDGKCVCVCMCMYVFPLTV